MSIWVRSESAQVYINISGDVCAEHVEFLRNKLLEHLQYGYRRIVINMDDVQNCHNHALTMLNYVQWQMSKCEGVLIIEDGNGLIGTLSTNLQ